MKPLNMSPNLLSYMHTLITEPCNILDLFLLQQSQVAWRIHFVFRFYCHWLEFIKRVLRPKIYIIYDCIGLFNSEA